MRQALGLFGQRASHPETGGGSRQGGGAHMQVGARRHRFVQDGEVPVSVVRGRREQVASQVPAPRTDARDRLLDEQTAERTGREQAERRLTEAQTLIRTLQTRLGHAELERDEAIEEAKSLRQQLATERAAAEEKLAERAANAEQRRERAPLKVAPEIDAADDQIEPEPVKWWL